MFFKLVCLAMLAGLVQAADTTDYNLTDYRILGHMMYKSSSSSSCADSFIVACGYVGNFTLRLSPNSIKILPPAVSVAFFRGEVIGCPSGAGSVTYNSVGSDGFASGSFDADSGSEVLTSPTIFTLEAGGGEHMLQMRFPGTNCVHTFELVDATTYILDVAPVNWLPLSALSSAGRMVPHAAAALAAGLAAVLLLM